jgi:hypothetical protein
MSHTTGALASYGQQSANIQNANAPPVSSSLDGIRRRIEQITLNVGDMHGIADRACGQTHVAAETKGAPQAVPNGMLDEIENALDILVSLSNAAVARLSRIA